MKNVLFPLASGLSVLPAASVPEPEEGCEPENLFFRQDLPITVGRGGAWGWRDTCAGREAGSDLGVEPVSERQQG